MLVNLPGRVAPAQRVVARGATVTFPVCRVGPRTGRRSVAENEAQQVPQGQQPHLRVSADKKSGVFTWAVGGTVKNATYSVTFTAANSPSGLGQDQHPECVSPLMLASKEEALRRIEEPPSSRASETPAMVEFSNGFPNPSRGAVEFALDLPRDAQVEWAVFDGAGPYGAVAVADVRRGAARRSAGTARTRRVSGRRPASTWSVRASGPGAFTRRVVSLRHLPPVRLSAHVAERPGGCESIPKPAALRRGRGSFLGLTKRARQPKATSRRKLR